MDNRYHWSRRHWLPCLSGSLAALIYANLMAWGIIPILARYGYEMPPWAVGLTAQMALWLGFWLGRLAWFK